MPDQSPEYLSGTEFKLLLKAEQDQILKHRDRSGRNDWNGLALSGGGIRSAIFCLGALQALAERNVLGNFDYISTVSGGGYIGAALQWFWRTDPSTGTSSDNFPFGTPRRPGTKDQIGRLAYLRAHGQYLTPDERMSIWSMTSVVIRTLFLNLAVWLPLGTGFLFVLIAAFQPLNYFATDSLFPNVYAPLVPSRWQSNCMGGCTWPLEIFFGLCTVVGLLIIAGFGSWAIAFSLDTRISSKQDAAPQNRKRYGFVAAALACCVVVYVVLDKFVLRFSNAFALWITFALIVAAVILIFLFILQARDSNASSNYSWRRKYETVAGAWFPWITILLAVGSIPVVPNLLVNHAGPFFKVLAGTVGVLSGVISAAVGHNAQSQREIPSDNKRWVLMIVSALFLYTIALVAYAAAQLLFDPSVFFDSAYDNVVRDIIFVAIALAFVMAIVTNVNYVGLHRFYRDRLMEAFMPAKDPVDRDVVEMSPDADRLSMADLWPPIRSTASTAGDQAKRLVPYPLVNTNAIMINDADRTLSWRGGDSFVISPMYTGCTATGWEETARHIRKHGPLTLPSAMAASGAALNENAAYVGAGVTRDRLLSIVLMLLNLRLGMWVGLPSNTPQIGHAQEPNHYNPAFRYGMTRTGYTRYSSFVELSDGGHFDNLGIYELVRRKLSVILAIDGEEDPATAMPALFSTAQRVKEDFGTIIDLDGRLDDLIPIKMPGYPADAKFVRFPYFVAPIQYRKETSDEGNREGILIYVKLSLAQSIGFAARGYRAQNPDFPHQSTANQFFLPEQVEAYREVGYINAGIALDTLGLMAGTIDINSVKKRYDARKGAVATD